MSGMAYRIHRARVSRVEDGEGFEGGGVFLSTYPKLRGPELNWRYRVSLVFEWSVGV